MYCCCHYSVASCVTIAPDAQGLCCCGCGIAGPCSQGFTCPEGSTSAAPVSCPATMYCPIVGANGSSLQTPCPAGSYCPQGSAFAISCPAGRWSSALQSACSPCDAGYFGSDMGMTTSSCSGPCVAGYFCAAGSTLATAQVCPAGYYCPGASPSGTANPCPAGWFCAAGSAVVSAANQCSPGQYSVDGAAACVPCPGGFYGNATALPSPLCSGQCPAGYYCPVATVVPRSCGNASVYCSQGSLAPVVVTPGYYTTGGATSATQTQQNECPSGYYCTAGVASPCPAGTYRSITRAATVADCAACTAGYYCAQVRFRSRVPL